MKDYLISWVQGGDDFRPLFYPPDRGIVGWWKTGETAKRDAILLAWVRAKFDSDARDAILTYWPDALEAGDWRFFGLKDSIQLSDWMKARI